MSDDIANADANATDPSAVVQSRTELEANLAEYQVQLEQVRIGFALFSEGESIKRGKKTACESAATEEGLTTLARPHFASLLVPLSAKKLNNRSTPSSRPSLTTSSTSSSSPASWR